MAFQQGIILGRLLSSQDLFSDGNPCDKVFEDAGDYWVFGDTSSTNIPYMVCFKNDTGIDWAQPEIDISNCLTDLHVDQGDACITVDSSPCEDELHYKANGGHIESLRILSILEDGSDNPDLQFNPDQGTTLKEAWQALADETTIVRGDSTYGPYAFLADVNTGEVDPDQKLSFSSIPSLQVNWQGEDLADC